jgi:hypothetical protein
MLMPLMDGFRSRAADKQAAGESWCPSSSSLAEGETLVRCLEAGGDDFSRQAHSRVILEAKIKAMDRLRRLRETVLQQRDLIAMHNEHLLSEQRAWPKAVFDKTHSGCLDAPNIATCSRLCGFNGDLLLAAFQPSGGMHVLLVILPGMVTGGD